MIYAMVSIGGSRLMAEGQQTQTPQTQTIPIRIDHPSGSFVITITVTPQMGDAPVAMAAPVNVVPVEISAPVNAIPAYLGRVSIPSAAVEKPKIKEAVAPEPRAAKLKNQFVGAVGERSVFKMDLIRVKQRRTGTTTEYFYTFRDGEGNTLLWSTHRDKRLLTGNEYTVKATVKSHIAIRNENTTMITRGRVVS